MPTEIQTKIINDLNMVRNFYVADEIRNRIIFLKNYLKRTGLRAYVLGISGGIDSTTAGKLAQLAVVELRAEGYPCEFIAVRLPYGVQKDSKDADAAMDFIKPDDRFIIDIKPAVDGLWNEMEMNFITKPYKEDFAKGNAKARQRMIAQYAVAGTHKGLVIGTDHGAEAVMGFFTKFGDGAADILPLTGLNKRRVRAIAEALGAPAKLVNKTPTADLEDENPQLPDETAFGITYEEIDDFLEGKEVFPRVHDIIVNAYHATEHKRKPPVAY